MATPLYYIGNNDVLIDKFKQCCTNNGFVFEKYDIEKRSFDFQYLFLIEPCLIQDVYYNLNAVWKQYLHVENKGAKLIILGLGSRVNCKEEKECPNYINLLTFDGNLQKYLDHANTLESIWKGPQDVNDLNDKLELFFKGHHSISLKQKLNYLKQTMVIINDTYAGEVARTEKELIDYIKGTVREQFNAFMSRWYNYHEFFNLTPFLKEKRAIFYKLNQIEKYLIDAQKPKTKHEELFKKLACNQGILEISNILENIDSKYIRPERDGKKG